jgi:hypothetical protein
MSEILDDIFDEWLRYEDNETDTDLEVDDDLILLS